MFSENLSQAAFQLIADVCFSHLAGNRNPHPAVGKPVTQQIYEEEFRLSLRSSLIYTYEFLALSQALLARKSVASLSHSLTTSYAPGYAVSLKCSGQPSSSSAP